MKKSALNILFIASVIVFVGFLMDSDPKEPSMLMRFVEFFGMTGIVFLLISMIYYPSIFVYKKIGK
jgi:hypothetical protein